MDATLIQQCADPGLKPAIVEKFVARAGAGDPLAISVRAGGRVILVPPPKSPDDTMALARRYVGQAVVRVGITQYPAGVGITNAAQLSPDLVDACKNIRMGTSLFGKVYRIVTKWYGTANDEAFDDAIIAWKTGTFEGHSVFSAEDPGPIKVEAPPETAHRDGEVTDDTIRAPASKRDDKTPEPDDPNRASIRIDLSGIGGVSAKK